MSLSILTYNILRSNDHESFRRIIDYVIIVADADIVGLQEVPDYFYKLLIATPLIMERYTFIEPHHHHDGDMLLVKRKLSPTLYESFRLPNTSLDRHGVVAAFTINATKIVIGSAHLESVFFTKEATQVKCSQMTGMIEVMNAIGGDSIIMICDCNLTQGTQLPMENQCIDNNGLTDVWKLLHGTSDDYNDMNYRLNDATWDSRNPKVPTQEYHRPDRIFLRNNNVKQQIIPIQIDRLVSSLSDHYALLARFQL